MSLLDFFFPRRCGCCGRRLSHSEDALCLPCALHLGRVEETDITRSEMAKRFWGLVDVQWAVALWRYQRLMPIAHLIHNMKYHNSPLLCRVIGQIAATHLQQMGLLDDIDIIVPMPLAKKREKKRGYNQCAKIAIGMSDITDIPVETRAVERTKFTRSQTKLDRRERMDNVEGLFRLVHPELLSGRHVLLIDDVCTTGATLTACAKVISPACAKVSVFALAATRVFTVGLRH